MKKKMKQLMAVVMAVAMVLSLSVTAFAGETTYSGDNATFSNVITTSGDTTVKNLPASGGVTAGAKSEGPLPEDPVELIFPTIPANPGRDDGVTANSADSFGVFDIILDPHQLIKKTDAARYVVSGDSNSVAKTFDPDSRLFFLKSIDDKTNAQTYAGQSWPLTIENRGRQPVAVNLSVNFEYEPAFITLVSGKDGLHTKSGDELNAESAGAEMYFALNVSSGSTGPYVIVDPDVDENAPTAPFVTVSGKGDYLNAMTLSGDSFESSVNFLWATDASGDEVVDENFDLRQAIVRLCYEKPVTTMSGGELLNGAINVRTEMPDGYTATVSGESVVTGGSVGSGDGVTSGDAVISGGTVTIGITSSSGDVASITLDLKNPDPRKMKPTLSENNEDYDQVVQFKARETGVILQTAIAGNKTYYKEHWVNPGSTASGDPQGITNNGYYWELLDQYKHGPFPKLTFNLEGNINDDDMWDSVGTDNPVSFELIWDVMQKSTYYDKVPDLSTTSGGDVQKAPRQPQGDLPTVTVTTRATTSTKKTVVITWTNGTEDYAAYVPSTTVTTSNNKTLTMNKATTATGGTLTNTNAYSTLATNGVTGTVTFTDPNGVLEDYTVTTTALR